MHNETILAFDTSSNTSVALLHQGSITAKNDSNYQKSGIVLLPLINELLAAQHLSLQDVDRIIVGIGPGSFTGVRVALSVAQGLQLALPGTQFMGCSSLAFLAAQAYTEFKATHITVVQDARMDEVYTASYVCTQDKFIEKSMLLTAPDDLQVAQNSCVVGNAADKLKSKLLLAQTDVSYLLTQNNLAAFSNILACNIQANYLRDKVTS